ncbi:MAG: DAK2 domain-containing protein [Clostridia bacterium]|nr:DAK2 domain-containing protein [Clostridia bacterium]
MDDRLIDGALFENMVRGGAENLYANKGIVNDLNVFPIPDGDTGDNMYMTIDSGASAPSDGKSELGSVSARIAHGMLLGARGNSGVILSRIFAGIAAGLQDVSEADIRTFGSALQKGSEEAYNAVSVPVEGTILTVFRDAVSYAGGRINEHTTLDGYFMDLITELRNSLERTPELLDVLKEAGVVDSGGAGLVYIVEGMKNALDGVDISRGGHGAPSAAKNINVDTFTEDSVLEYGYCTEFLMRLQRSKTDIERFDINEFTELVKSMGDSVVSFLDGTIVKVHVHTMHPGEVLNECQKYGEFLTLKIENMMLQHNETVIENRFEFRCEKARKKFGAVAVASGEGISEMFRSLGVDAVVDGGQSMNPSAGDFIEAFKNVNADVILVFPNNGNVILAAEQAAEMYDESEVRVVPTKTVGEGYSALSMLDTDGRTADELAEEAASYAQSVVTGFVSRAGRTTEMDGVSIVSGDYIGFADDVVYSDSPDKCEAAYQLCERLDAGSFDVILLLSGADATEEEAQKLYDRLKKQYGSTEIIMMDGGQPLHDFILVLE